MSEDRGGNANEIPEDPDGRPTEVVDGRLLEAVEPYEVICHGELAPYSCIFDGSRLVGLIDFDTVRPDPASATSPTRSTGSPRSPPRTVRSASSRRPSRLGGPGCSATSAVRWTGSG